jgi:hypothetical protein
LLVVAGVELRSNDDSSSNNNVRSSTTLFLSAANIIPTSSSSSFGSDDQPKKKKVLTEADILARSKSLRTGPFQNPNGIGNKGGEEEVPKLFTPQIYNDIQTALLLLERRVKNGKFGLDLLDIDEFVGCTSRIVNEMYDYLADPSGCSDRIAKVYPASTFHAENGDVLTATTTTIAKTTAAKTTSVVTGTTTAVDNDNDTQVYVPPPPRKG